VALLVVIVLVSAALGSLFGSTEVVTVAFAKDEGHGGLVGVLLATWASGSLISGLITGLVSVQATPRVRFRWGTLGLALAMSPLPLIRTCGCWPSACSSAASRSARPWWPPCP
jgi:hypothetical protein